MSTLSESFQFSNSLTTECKTIMFFKFLMIKSSKLFGDCMRLLFIFLYVFSYLNAAELLEQISVEDTFERASSIFIEEQTQINNQTLSDKLFNVTVVNQTQDGTSANLISIRANNYRATEYYEDGIPLYRTSSGFTDLSMYKGNATEIEVNAGGAQGLYAPSASGGEILLTSKKLEDCFHASVATTISTNDRYANAIISHKNDDWYFKLELNTLKQDFFNISKKFDYTALQSTNKRVNSDKVQQDGSLKIGYNINETSSIAFKISRLISEYGLPPETSDEETWDEYTRVDSKELSSYWFYYDYKNENLNFSARAYYDEYKDLWNIYDSSSYSALKFSPSTFYDSRLGAITSLRSNFSDTQKGH